MGQQGLFGDTAAKTQQPKHYPTTYLGTYNADEVMSAFIKSIRLGKTEDALFWMEVMLKGGADVSYVARRLAIESQESGYGMGPALYAAAVLQIMSVGRDHAQDALFQLTVYLCTASKWWEHETTRTAMKTWYAAEKEAIAIRDGQAEPRPIPVYAVDVHTKRGRERKKKGQSIDERFSGSEKGIFSMIKLYEVHGRVSEQDHLTPEQERESRAFLYRKKATK